MAVKGRCLLKSYEGGYQSGQMGQTVNLLALAFGGSNPSPPTLTMSKLCGNSSVDRALAFQAGGRGFEPRFPLLWFRCNSSVVEHFLGKEEVLSSTLSYSSASTTIQGGKELKQEIQQII